MFKTTKKIDSENQTKDFRKLARLIILAKGHRTINGFSADCRLNPLSIEGYIFARTSNYPDVQFLRTIADNSDNRVSLTDLKLACGYSLYENNSIEEIKRIPVSLGDFYYADFGDNCLDSEYGGMRVVLVLQNNMGNLKSSTTIVAPLTSRSRSSQPTHVPVGVDCGLRYDSIISCEQIRCISKRRLMGKVSECPEHIMMKVRVALSKATGVIDLRVNENDASEALFNLNKNKATRFRQDTQVNSYNVNNNFNNRQQEAFA